MFLKTSSGQFLFAIFLVVLLTFLLIIAVVLRSQDSVRIDTFAANDYYSITEEEELALVAQWIEEEDLNQYGDQEGTVYATGDPLLSEFDDYEKTLFEYLREQHPDEPWLQ